MMKTRLISAAAAVFLSLFVSLTVSAQESGIWDQLSKAAQGKGNITVAVLDFVNADGKQSALGRYFSEESVKYLVKKSKVKVVERAQINQIVSELEFHSTGYVSEESTVEIGGMLGADAIVVGTLTLMGRKIEVKMKVLDTRTAEILAIGSSELSGAKYIKMYNEIVGE
jgi:TolB-like protein